MNIPILILKFNHSYLRQVRFTQEPIRANDFENINGKYSWVAYTTWRPVRPMKNVNYVAFFKTLKGAKRNFIRNYLKGE